MQVWHYVVVQVLASHQVECNCGIMWWCTIRLCGMLRWCTCIDVVVRLFPLPIDAALDQTMYVLLASMLHLTCEVAEPTNQLNT